MATRPLTTTLEKRLEIARSRTSTMSWWSFVSRALILASIAMSSDLPLFARKLFEQIKSDSFSRLIYPPPSVSPLAPGPKY
jgi:hypothetical protein